MLLTILALSALALGAITLTELRPRIVGGDEADYTPWIAALSYGDVSGRFQCAASIITDRHLLTAAHCIQAAYFNGSLASTYMATVGSNLRNGSGQNYALIKNYTHPEWDMFYVKNDIAIVVTNVSIAFSDMVRPVVLNFNKVEDGVPAIILGWGSDGPKTAPSLELQELDMLTVNYTFCLDETRRVGSTLNITPPYIDPQKELCAFRAPGQGTCKGDSGSPLVCASSDQQIGLTSWGIPCALGAPDMFTRISNYKDFIFTTLADMGYQDKLNYAMDSCS